ncbi:MAG TPA: hypothetical protein DD414_08285 [Lachnospiraceae bacterium]|nr:hypothetical protein [Lachnospiraceae bacterium]
MAFPGNLLGTGYRYLVMPCGTSKPVIGLLSRFRPEKGSRRFGYRKAECFGQPKPVRAEVLPCIAFLKKHSPFFRWEGPAHFRIKTVIRRYLYEICD